jgi:hypothetical protein
VSLYDVAAEQAATGWQDYLSLQLAIAKADHNAGRITDSEHEQIKILNAHLLAGAKEDETGIELDADKLGIELRQVRDRAQLAPRERVRRSSRQSPNRRSRRGARTRRNVRTRRAKARAPSGDPSPDPHPSDHVEEPEKSSGCSTSPQLDFLDAVALSLGWERAA